MAWFNIVEQRRVKRVGLIVFRSVAFLHQIPMGCFEWRTVALLRYLPLRKLAPSRSIWDQSLFGFFIFSCSCFDDTLRWLLMMKCLDTRYLRQRVERTWYSSVRERDTILSISFCFCFFILVYTQANRWGGGGRNQDWCRRKRLAYLSFLPDSRRSLT